MDPWNHADSALCLYFDYILALFDPILQDDLQIIRSLNLKILNYKFGSIAVITKVQGSGW